MRSDDLFGFGIVCRDLTDEVTRLFLSEYGAHQDGDKRGWVDEGFLWNEALGIEHPQIVLHYLL